MNYLKKYNNKLEEFKSWFLIKDSKLYWAKPTSYHEKRGISGEYPAGGLWKDDRHYTGYYIVCLNGNKFKQHVIMYMIYNNVNEFNDGDVIDHINQNSEDNRKENLRCISQQQNVWNSRKQKNNTSGHPGVSYYKKNKKWGVRVTKNNKRIFIGLFDSYDVAVSVYEAENNKHRKDVYN